MMQNITLSADSETIAQMRNYAKEHNTTVNQIIRDHFEELIKHKRDQESLARKALADEYLKFSLEHAGRSEAGWKFDREEIHKRGAILAKFFIDTNIFIYAVDDRDARKQLKAAESVHRCIADMSGCLSTQVLQEFASVALLKLKQPEEEVIRSLNYLESLEVVSITPAIIRRGVQLTGELQLHFWDATILAAAEHAGCEVLYSEDFQSGQSYGSVRAENPLL